MPRHSQLPILKEKDKMRFWGYVKKGCEDECWNWFGGKVEYGRVGVFQKNNKNIRVARIAYQIVKGEFDYQLIIKQTCRNHLCCNPKHLYPSNVIEIPNQGPDYADSAGSLVKNND